MPIEIYVKRCNISMYFNRTLIDFIRLKKIVSLKQSLQIVASNRIKDASHKD